MAKQVMTMATTLCMKPSLGQQQLPAPANLYCHQHAETSKSWKLAKAVSSETSFRICEDSDDVGEFGVYSQTPIGLYDGSQDFYIGNSDPAQSNTAKLYPSFPHVHPLAVSRDPRCWSL